MDAVLPQVALVAILVLLNAVFAGTELALVSLRESRLRLLEQGSPAGAALARLARDPNRFLATIQIGITLAGFLASAAAALTWARPLEERLSFLGAADEPVAVLVVTLLLAYVTLVLGELVPKRIAMQRAERWGLLAARPLAVMSSLTRPGVWLLSRSTDAAMRVLGGDPSRQRDDVTEEELRDLVATQPGLTPKQRLIIEGAFEISGRSLHDVLRPRGDVFALDADASSAAALAELSATTYSRAPVRSGPTLDDVIGVVHLRDLLTNADGTVREVMSELRAFPESIGVLDALHDLQTHRAQIAIVVDEHGSVAGIVTIEDLIEELVGEIYDESDRDVVAVRREADRSLVISGRFPVHDLVDIGVDAVPEGDYATVAGLVLDRLGFLPETPGDRVSVGDWEFEVCRVARRAITEVRVRPTVAS